MVVDQRQSPAYLGDVPTGIGCIGPTDAPRGARQVESLAERAPGEEGHPPGRRPRHRVSTKRKRSFEVRGALIEVAEPVVGLAEADLPLDERVVGG